MDQERRDPLDGMCEDRRADAERFVETGDAPREFLDRDERCEACGNAIEMVFRAQAKAFEDLAAALRKSA